MKFIRQLIKEVAANGCPVGKLIVCHYRISSALWTRRSHLFWRIFYWIVVAYYRYMFSIAVGVYLPESCVIGSGLRVFHGYGLVVHPSVRMGKNVVLRHGVTVGAGNAGAPTIGDNVDIGAGALIIGDIAIGNNVTIGAGSVVVKSVDHDHVVAGNPARVIR